MRTTLKKAIGREADGNGQGVFPPGALTPVTLYRQPPPPKPGFARVVGKILFFLATALVVIVCGLVGGFYLWVNESVGAVRCQTANCKGGARRLDVIKDAHQPAIALAIGYDH